MATFALPEAKVVRRELGYPSRGGRAIQGEGGGTVLGHHCPGQGRPSGYPEEKGSTISRSGWNKMDIAARHCRSAASDVCMDRRDLARLGHHVVSRRVALGYRNRTDLASSLPFTVRTLADIEHGVRKASPGTYAMLENKLAWAPGSVDTILAGGEPQETVVELRRPTSTPLVPRLHRSPLPRLHRGVAAGATTAHHRPPQQTPRGLGRLGRRPRPARRLARTGLAAST